MTDNLPSPGRNLAPRFEFIEWRLFWEGHLNRSDLEERFGISTPQASVDLRNYREVAGDNIEYNATEKRFVATSGMKPRFLRVSANRLLLQLRALVNGVVKRDDVPFSQLPSVDVVPEIVRDVRAAVLQKILTAIRLRKAVSIYYRSLTSTRWRDIAPHALAFDGHRWHARAYCCERNEFRDFVLTRIERLGELKLAQFNPENDLAWQNKIELLLCPHPGLSKAQSEAVQCDYDMRDGIRRIEMRLSLAYYFIKRLNLDIDILEPARAQICLENLSEVEAAIVTAREKSKKLCAEA
ncbi:WYL domain-containing protein [Cognatishimia sp. F0-27]|uniref:transcriptional regulator n=1 Tax=Cognatishimia sp. F0-27 TaxID=2816855 RepID=UPI001D0C0F28|nr:WYL domain-containing protein [Cognatishimia sp. F0-27]MCC1493541.1 WYL domain-containing protein [Cognatishimia sp. F0-27]